MSAVAPGASRRASAPSLTPRVFAMKPIGRSPAFYAPKLADGDASKKSSSSKSLKSRSRGPVVARLFGNGDAKAKIAELEYELETERAHSSGLGGKLRDATARAEDAEGRLEMYRGRLKEAEKDVFKLEAQIEQTQKGFDAGMAVAKRQIKLLEGMLEEEKKKNK